MFMKVVLGNFWSKVTASDKNNDRLCHLSEAQSQSLISISNITSDTKSLQQYLIFSKKNPI